MLDGVKHIFYASSEYDINQKIEGKISYKDFYDKNEKAFIEDNFIQMLLATKILLDVPSYNYKNTELFHGLDPLSGTVFRQNQVQKFLDKLNNFELNLGENKKITTAIQLTKEEVMSELEELKNIVKKALRKNMCIYHVGI